MRRIVTRVLLVAVLVIGACSTAPPDSLSGFLARTFPQGAGGSVVAARGDRMLHCEGFGMADREAQIAATCDTVYDVMSITKQFTAAAVLKLETLGKLRVADPIGIYLGPVPVDKRGITVHHLLTHTAGLVEALGGDYDVLTREAMIGGAMSSDLISRPGAEFHYSNVGYSLLAAIVEKASGQGYEQFLATHLFGPAGMRSTGYILPQWDRNQIAVEYGADDNSQGRPYDHPWAADGPHWNLRGNGGILSTARDMFRWHRALTGDKILPRSTREKLFAPHTRAPEPNEYYGYGWSVIDTEHGRIAWHDGGNSWSLANYAVSLRDATMAFWVSNHAYQEGHWNLEDLEPELTLGILHRARTQPS
jgi:CubicO group peptidase (beta-lactamase class C family)